MNVTFTVQIELDDLSRPLLETALDIQDALEQDGFLVNSVNPWARPTDPNSLTAEAVQNMAP